MLNTKSRMAGSFTLVSKPSKKISLERSTHACPKCKHKASVQLIRSERQWIVFNKCISNSMRVRYECSNCRWRNQELPIDEFESFMTSSTQSQFDDTMFLY